MQETRVPLGRKVLAGALAFAILGLTYVLFDPDLGTPAPLFGEFTCRGQLAVTATGPSGTAELGVPETGIRFEVTHAGMPHGAFVLLWLRAPGGDWTQEQELVVESGQDLFFVPRIESGTEAYVEARDTRGAVCDGRSATLRAL